MDLFTPTAKHGYHCSDCGRLWDAYQVPCDTEVALAHMKSNARCMQCGSGRVLIVMPKRYEELVAEQGEAP